MVKIVLGRRVSASAAHVPPSTLPPNQESAAGSKPTGRRFGFVVGDAAVKTDWLVRFDDGEEVEVPSGKLKGEHQGEALAVRLPADELHAACHLPTAEQRAELIFEFDTSVYDFRGWFVDDVAVPGAEALGSAGGLALPPEARRPPHAGGAGGAGGDGGDDDCDGQGLLLSNLHLTPAARQPAGQVGVAITPRRACRGVGGGGGTGPGAAAPPTVVPTGAIDRMIQRQRQQQQQQPENLGGSGGSGGSGGRGKAHKAPRANRTAFHDAYAAVMRADARSAPSQRAARARIEGTLRAFVREVRSASGWGWG